MRTALFLAAALAAGSSFAQPDERIFLTLDENRDGALTQKEAQGMPSLAKRFAKVDADGNGTLSRYEFNTFISQGNTGDGSFAALDRNADGGLTKDELIRRFPGLAAGFDIADQNNDGRLNAAEFREARALSANMYGEGSRSAQKRELFRSLDMDGDRTISRTEAKWSPALERDFQEADRNADGRLGVSEFGLTSVYTLAR